jgi:hypothetical protein
VLLEKNLAFRLKRTDLPDGIVRIDARDRDGLKKTISRRRKKGNMKALSEGALDRLIGQHSLVNTMTPAESAVLVQHAVDISDSRRGIFKIAYELSLRWLGAAYIDDPVAKILREVALGKQQPEATNVVHHNILWGSDLNELAFWNDEKDCHVAFSQTSGSRVLMVLKIFDLFSAWIVVSEAAKLYANEARFIHINPVSGARRETTFSDEIQRMVSEAAVERASQIKLL